MRFSSSEVRIPPEKRFGAVVWGGESFIASRICCRSKLFDLSASCRAAIFDSRAETRSSSSAISEEGIADLTGVGEEGGVSNGAFVEESEESEFAP